MDFFPSLLKTTVDSGLATLPARPAKITKRRVGPEMVSLSIRLIQELELGYVVQIPNRVALPAVVVRLFAA